MKYLGHSTIPSSRVGFLAFISTFIGGMHMHKSFSNQFSTENTARQLEPQIF